MQLRLLHLVILFFLISFAAVAAVLFTPALPAMSQDLGLSQEQGQLALSLFLVGYAVGTLFYGPLANRFGRKQAVLSGMFLAIVGALITLSVSWCHCFSLFLFGRVVMAVGSTAGLKVSMTMLGDVYRGQEATRKIALILLSFAVGPSLAIGLGGFLTQHFGWISPFYFLFGYSILLTGMAFFLPETAHALDSNALKIKAIITGYYVILKEKRLFFTSLVVGIVNTFAYLFAAKAPFIAMDRLGLKPELYGLLNFLLPSGIITGSFLAHQFAHRPPLTVCRVGAMIAFIASLAMLILFLAKVLSTWTLFLPVIAIYLGLSIIYPTATALILSHAPHKSNASAIMNFLGLGVPVIVLMLSGFFKEVAILPLFYLCLVSGIFLLLAPLQRLER